MAKLSVTNMQKDLIRLILRSDDAGDGWRKVTVKLWPHVENVFPPDLAETRTDDAGHFIRLTDRAHILADYL